MHRALALVVLAVLAPGCAYLDSNFRTVQPDAFYRSGQMSAPRLAEAIEDHHIATVINLRGASDESWYVEKLAVCDARGVAHYDLDWTKRRIPEPESLAAYVTLLQAADRPLLVHCQGGTHRTGVASAVYILLEGGDVLQAREEFGIFFDDAPIGELLDLYEGSPLPFADWVLTDYPALWQAEQAD
jgi:protein tyrosine/serine phosphatase